MWYGIVSRGRVEREGRDTGEKGWPASSSEPACFRFGSPSLVPSISLPVPRVSAPPRTFPNTLKTKHTGHTVPFVGAPQAQSFVSSPEVSRWLFVPSMNEECTYDAFSVYPVPCPVTLRAEIGTIQVFVTMEFAPAADPRTPRPQTSPVNHKSNTNLFFRTSIKTHSSQPAHKYAHNISAVSPVRHIRSPTMAEEDFEIDLYGDAPANDGPENHPDGGNKDQGQSRQDDRHRDEDNSHDDDPLHQDNHGNDRHRDDSQDRHRDDNYDYDEEGIKTEDSGFADGQDDRDSHRRQDSRDKRDSYDEERRSPKQGVKRKGSDEDETPVDRDATSAVLISELAWWTTDDEIRGWVFQANAEDDLKDISFSEHKVNGKSKG